MSKPIINDLEVDLRDYWKPSEADYGCVSWNDGAFRYHIWTTFPKINPDARRVRSTGRATSTIYRNSVDLNDRTFRTRYLDATSKTWSPVIEEIKRRVADEGLIEKARRDAQAKKDKEEADRLEAIRKAKITEVFGTHGESLRHLLGKALACMKSASLDERRGADSQRHWAEMFDDCIAACDAADKAIGLKDE